MTKKHKGVDDCLDGVDESKRSTLRKLVIGGAFVAPTVMSFPMDGLNISSAQAGSNTSGPPN